MPTLPRDQPDRQGPTGERWASDRSTAYFGLRMILISMIKIITVLGRRLRWVCIVSSCQIRRRGHSRRGICF